VPGNRLVKDLGALADTSSGMTITRRVGILTWLLLASVPAVAQPYDCATPLLPSTESLRPFLVNRCYEQLGWMTDLRIRATGPIVDGTYFSVHGDVRVHYPPAVFQWLQDGRPPATTFSDGTVVVKEQYAGPGTADPTALGGWTIMLRDGTASHDGWYWAYVDAQDPSYDSGETFLQYCVACHAAADNEHLLFASLSNVTGPIVTYGDIDTGPVDPSPPAPGPHVPPYVPVDLPDPLPVPDAAFVDTFREMTPPPSAVPLPQSSNDHVVPVPGAMPEHFVTSDVCSGCHDADSLLHGLYPNMMMQADGQNLNVSPYGEWSASLMGLAGRDPVFRAQLESERALHPELGDSIDNFCMTCHGVMGKRQLALDTGGTGLMSLAATYQTGDEPMAKYAALARDGVSCTACHHVAAEGLGEPSTFTGQFNLGPADQLYGQYQDTLPYAMEQAVGAAPTFGAQMDDSALCGSCHTVNTPILNVGQPYTPEQMAAAPTQHEQTTYLEWVNSSFSEPGTFASCQDCHMPGHFDDPTQPLAFRIANIQDDRYPYFEHAAPDADIALQVRDGYARHLLVGINLFVMEMFQQFTALLGVNPVDGNIATSEHPASSLLLAQDQAVRIATQQTATVELLSLRRVRRSGSTPPHLEVAVRVTNKAGHRFPSGVGFRRAIVELVVEDRRGRVLWGSGRANALGVIVDGDDEPLATEFSLTQWQPHYDVITSQDQVQIFEERHLDDQGTLSTSFLALKTAVKDNRLEPMGWSTTKQFAEETKPIGTDDPSYFDGSGTDDRTYQIPLRLVRRAARVRAVVHYQAIPPYYLRDRFATAQGPETQRLYWVASRLNLDGEPIEGWTLEVASDVRDRRGRGRNRWNKWVAPSD
jgi:mono/diheme cytochrome c family protein